MPHVFAEVQMVDPIEYRVEANRKSFLSYSLDSADSCTKSIQPHTPLKVQGCLYVRRGAVHVRASVF